MAKTAAAQKQPEPTAAPEKEKAKREPKVRTVKLLRVPKEDEKIGGTQVKGIIACLVANGKTMTTDEIKAELGNHITTRQDPLRVYMFYQKSLIDQGLISVSD